VLAINAFATFLDISFPNVVSVKVEINAIQYNLNIDICRQCFLTHYSIHDNQCDILLYIKLSLIAFHIQMLDAIFYTFVEHWNVFLEIWKTERTI
jgi:hypothetical protein